MNQNPKDVQPQEPDYHVGICPYYIRDRGKGVVYCECAKFHFPDKIARREILYGFCAHPDGYKRCVLKQMLDHYYERKYETIKNQERMTDDEDESTKSTTPTAHKAS